MVPEKTASMIELIESKKPLVGDLKSNEMLYKETRIKEFSKFGSGKTRDSGNKKMGFRASNALASI